MINEIRKETQNILKWHTKHKEIDYQYQLGHMCRRLYFLSEMKRGDLKLLIPVFGYIRILVNAKRLVFTASIWFLSLRVDLHLNVEGLSVAAV